LTCFLGPNRSHLQQCSLWSLTLLRVILSKHRAFVRHLRDRYRHNFGGEIMGFRYRRSVQVIPGLRLNFSKSGIGYSVGMRGARISHSPTGRVTRSVGIPGTGMYYVTTRGSGGRRRSANQSTAHSRATAARIETLPQQIAHPGPWSPPSAGLFASSEERQLVRAWRDNDTHTLIALAGLPGVSRVLACVMSMLKLAGTDATPLLPAFESLFHDNVDINGDRLLRKCASGLALTIGVCDGVSASLPAGKQALGLAYAEILQAGERYADALSILDMLTAAPVITLSKVDILSLTQAWDQVLTLTESAQADDDIGIALLVHRARAFRAQRLPDAALETLKEINLRSVDPDAKVQILLERAQAHELAGQHAAARKDAQSVLVLHADNPVARALAEPTA